MAPQDRPPAQHLEFLRAAADTVKRWGLFPIVRGAEARAHGLPRVGRAKAPGQNIVDLAQSPALGFQNTTLDGLAFRNGRARLRGLWLGLIGPNGPLPTHLTEFAFYERRYAKTQPFGDWLDVIAGRMLQLFYRAWADSQPAAMMDRGDEDRFGDYLALLSGAREGARADSAFPAQARLHYAAIFASRRSAAGIEDGLSHLMGQPVRLLEYRPRWRDIERDDRTRLGRSFAQLGGDAVLGARVKAANDAYRVMIRAKDFSQYKTLLPGGTRFKVAAEALTAFSPSHLEWDIAVELEEGLAPPLRLGGDGRLGWSSWVRRPSDSRTVRADAHLRKPRQAKRRADML